MWCVEMAKKSSQEVESLEVEANKGRDENIGLLIYLEKSAY